MYPRQLVLGQANLAGRFAVFQRLEDFQENVELGLGFLVAALGHLADAVCPFLYRVHIGQAQFRIDDVYVTDRVDGARYVRNVAVFKAADDFGNGVGFTDVAEEFIAQAFALGGTGYEAGNIDETRYRRNGTFRMIHICQDLNACVRYFDDAYIRFNRAERIVSRFCSGLGNCIKERALTDIRQADNTDFQIGTHE